MNDVYSARTGFLTVVKIKKRGRPRKCGCGCHKTVTHYLAADGCNMGDGCEWSVHARKRDEMKLRRGE